MEALRTPVTGCPWDLQQSFETIAPYTIEEAYEVADAIERGNLDDLKDELGDLLLQVVYHARMAQEQDSFDFTDVTDAICRKMIHRHPHVFGDENIRKATHVNGLWERIKAQEKESKGQAGKPKRLLDDIPLPLPALTRAVKLQNKAAKVGFDWPSLTPVLEKLDEEIAELKEAVEAANKDQAHIEEEFGDILFVLANVARHLNIDPENALRGANAKMLRRFAHIEDRLAEDGRIPQQSNLEEMDKLWDEAKAKDKEQN